MPGVNLTKADRQLIKSLLRAYETFQPQIGLFHEQLLSALKSSAALNAAIHSMRSRIKDRDHLADKLARKIRDCKEKEKAFEITPDNLLVKVNDLIGVRLLHLYTRQITAVDAALRDVFNEGKYDLLEGPFARTWDDESRQFLRTATLQRKRALRCTRAYTTSLAPHHEP